MSAWLTPVQLDTFYGDIFETRPLLVSRASPAASPFAGLVTAADVWAAVDAGLHYGTALDVVRFDAQRGVRATLNEEGRAPPAAVRAAVAAGASLRLLHPQRWPGPAGARLRATLAALEGLWECVAGCNLYYTPPGHQGFAPHWDDVDVFVLQLEGTKTWSVHGARCEEEVLPLTSSPDFAPGDVGPLALRATLAPGDVLYLPRGTTHAAVTPPSSGAPSLHATVSVCHRQTWGDLLRAALPAALDAAVEAHASLRACVPRGATRYMGLAYAETEEHAREGGEGGGADYRARAAARAAFEAAATAAAMAVVDALPLDDVVDRLAVDWIEARAPPGARAGGGGKASKRHHPKGKAPPPSLPTHIAPVAEGSAARLVVEGDGVAVYHCLANDPAAHAADRAAGDDDPPPPSSRLVFPLEAGPALEHALGVHSARPGDPVAVAGLPAPFGGVGAVRRAVGALLEAGVVVPA
jgi:lysine-specific demethylase/histidyl-hydroxylase NO66